MLDIKFPIIKLNPRFIRGRIRNVKDLCVVGEINLEKGCFDSSRIIDSTGRLYRVVGVEKKRWTCNPMNVFKKYRTIWVSLDIELVSVMSLVEVQDSLIALFDENPSWYLQYFESDSEMKVFLKSFDSIDGLIGGISVFP